jgi:hypothetical protein
LDKKIPATLYIPLRKHEGLPNVGYFFAIKTVTMPICVPGMVMLGMARSTLKKPWLIAPAVKLIPVYLQREAM